MIHPGKESVKRRDSHHQVEVCHDKIGIVYVDIQGAISQNDSRQTPCNKSRNQPNREQHGWIELQIPFPKGCDIVKGLHR